MKDDLSQEIHGNTCDTFCISVKDDVSFSYKYEMTPLSKIAKMILFQKIRLKSDSHLPKHFFLFALMIALQK